MYYNKTGMLNLAVIVFLVSFGYTLCSECTHAGACSFPGNGSLVCQNVTPPNLPKWTRRVTLDCFLGRNPDIEVNETTFSGEGWGSLKRLEIIHHSGDLMNVSLRLGANSFRRLVTLEELHIHMTGGRFLPRVFDGLDKLETLNVSNCVTMSQSQIIHAFTADAMKNLRRLIMTRAGDRDSGISLDTAFANFIGARPITFLDISYMRITLLNLTAFSLNCANLETILAEGLLASVFHQTVNDAVCKNLKLVDFSGVLAPHGGACAGEAHALKNEVNWRFNVDGFKVFSHAEEISLNSYCFSLLHMENVTKFRFDTSVDWNLRRLYFDRNFLEYADIEILCDQSTIELLSIRGNGMQFISPKFFTCMHTLKTLDLSTNKLHQMQERNESTFGNVFMYLPSLEEVSLSDNSLKDLPTNIFANNSFLRVIDVSGNKITEVHFLTRVSEELTMLNVSGNQISALDDISMGALSQASTRISKDKKSEPTPWLDLSRNPLSCSACEHHKFVIWYLSNIDAIVSPGQTHCLDDRGRARAITQSVADHLKHLCEEPGESRSITEVLSGIGAVLAVLVALLFLGRKFSNRCMTDIKIGETKRALREGRGEFEFLVFLAFNERDDQFIDEHVIDDLRENLRAVVGTRRDLVCKGDHNFRPGIKIDDNIVMCLNRCCLVLYVLSINSLKSIYCRREYDHAIEMGKPVVFMVKDRINEDELTPSMLNLYQKRARILWTRENGTYVLKPSWRTVCASLLELLAEK